MSRGLGAAFTVLSCILLACRTDRKRREIQMRTQIGQKLEEGGERERLKELLRIRLKECGWRDQLKEHCRGRSVDLPYDRMLHNSKAVDMQMPRVAYP